MKSYTKIWDQFQDFVVGVLKIPVSLPVAVEVILQYVAYLYHKGYSYRTMLTHMSVVAFAHRIRGIVSPTDLFIVKKLLVGIRNMAKKGVDIRKPITVALLGALLGVSTGLFDSEWDSVLFRAILAVMFAGGFRIGELVSSGGVTEHTVKYQHIFEVWSGSCLVAMLVKLESYKHSHGKQAVIRLNAHVGHIACPVTALVRYLTLRGAEHGFLFLRQTGKVVTRTWFADRLTEVLSQVGENPMEYNTHSLRIGATTQLMVNGASIPELMSFGRWSTSAYKSYVRPGAISV